MKIRLDGRKKKICFLAAGVVLVLIIGRAAVKSLKGAPVETAAASYETVEDRYTEEGTITAGGEYRLVSEVAGPVKEVMVRENDGVKAGDILFTVDDKDLLHGMMAFTNSQVMGLVDTSYKKWVVWDAAFSPNVIAVKKDSPYKTIEDLIAAMKENPGKITASSAGVGTGGHIGASVFAQGVGAEFTHIPYEGGNPAIIAALSGEVDFTAQLSMEMIDMIRSGDLIGLACLSDEDLVIDGPSGKITIPSIKSVAPEMEEILPLGESFGIMGRILINK